MTDVEDVACKDVVKKIFGNQIINKKVVTILTKNYGILLFYFKILKKLYVLD